MDIVEMLGQNFSDFKPDAYEWVTHIVLTTTLQLGLYMASCFFLFEVISEAKRVMDSGGSYNFKFFVAPFLRWLLAVTLASASTVILYFILSISSGVVSLFDYNSNGALNMSALWTSFDFEKVLPKDPLSALGSIFGLLTNPGAVLTEAIAGLIMFVISIIAEVIAYLSVGIIVVMRAFQLYIYLAVAPVPLSTIASSEFKGTATNFLKRVGAYAFQAVVLLVIIGLFSFFKDTIEFSFTPTGQLKAYASVLNSFVFAFVFIAAIWRSQAMSKEFLGVN